MDIDEILAEVRSYDGVLVLAPEEGSAFPEIAWGDSFVYYAPDGQVPTNEQPYATVVTKDYPGEPSSDLTDGRYRVNLRVDRETFERLTGQTRRTITTTDFTQTDVVLPHPVYGERGWVAVISPAERATATVLQLLRAGHDAAVARAQRSGPGSSADLEQNSEAT